MKSVLSDTLGLDGHLPLSKHRFISTGDPAVASEQVAKLFAPHRLEPVQGERPFHSLLHHARLNSLSFFFAQYHPEAVITASATRRFYLLHIPLAGACGITYGGRTVEVWRGAVAVTNPLDAIKLHWMDNCTQLVVKVDRRELETCLAAHLGHPPIQPILFDFQAPTPHESCAGLVRFVELICHDLDQDNSTFGSRHGEQPAEALFMNMMLRQLPNNYSTALSRPASRAAPYYVKRVEEYIRLYAGKPIGLKDMVAVSGVSSRALFKGFQGFRGMGPMAYLKMVRLEHVHAELSRAAGQRTVTEVANAWGFAHLGNFARDYKKRFGQRPSDTLRQRGP